MNGGMKYGEGAYGIVVDSSCKSRDNQTLCEILKNEDIKSIELFNYSSDSSIFVNINDFIQYVKYLDCCIAKYFKSYMVGFDKVKFFEEIKSIRLIYDIFGKDTPKYTTHLELKFKQFKFIGCLITSKNSKNIYIIFSKKCDNTIENICFNDKDFTKLNKDILKMIIKMQARNFAHYDIKPDNIISCSNPNIFKLIDWGLAGKITNKTFQYANPLCNTPLMFYISGFPAFMSIRALNYYTWYLKRKFWNSNIFKELYAILSSEFYEIVKLKLSTYKLIENYGKKIDVIAFGMSLAIIIFYNNLNWEKYKDYIINLVSFKGFKNAREAINL